VRLVQAVDVGDLALEVAGLAADRERLLEERDRLARVALVEATLTD
jgi:hypothetical protein